MAPLAALVAALAVVSDATADLTIKEDKYGDVTDANGNVLGTAMAEKKKGIFTFPSLPVDELAELTSVTLLIKKTKNAASASATALLSTAPMSVSMKVSATYKSATDDDVVDIEAVNGAMLHINSTSMKASLTKPDGTVYDVLEDTKNARLLAGMSARGGASLSTMGSFTLSAGAAGDK